MEKKQPSNKLLLRKLFNLIVDKDSKYVGNPKDFASIFWEKGSPDIGVEGKDGKKLHIGSGVVVTDEIIARVIAVIPNPDEIPNIYKEYAKDINRGVLKGTKFSVKADGLYLRILRDGLPFATASQGDFVFENEEKEQTDYDPRISSLLEVTEWVDKSEGAEGKYIKAFNKKFSKRGIKIKEDGETVIVGEVDDKLLIDVIFYFFPSDPTEKNIAEFVAMMNDGPLHGPDYIRLVLVTNKHGGASQIEVVKLGKVLTRFWDDGEEYEDLENHFPLYKDINIDSKMLQLEGTSNTSGEVGTSYNFTYMLEERKKFSSTQLLRFYIDQKLILIIPIRELVEGSPNWYRIEEENFWSIALYEDDYKENKKDKTITLKSVSVMFNNPWQ